MGIGWTVVVIVELVVNCPVIRLLTNFRGLPGPPTHYLYSLRYQHVPQNGLSIGSQVCQHGVKNQIGVQTDLE